MNTIRATLWELRRLRTLEASHNEAAIEYLNRASRGTGSKRAMDIGGTGDCPLTNNAGRYAQERESCLKAKRSADTIWRQIEPRLAMLDIDSRNVITLYYNVGMAWEDIPAAIKRSPIACERLHRETLTYLECAKEQANNDR